MAVSGNYDGRPGVGVQQVHGICAGRYDGSGGLAGFAFALRAEWLATGYRFPTEAKWYFGDNDLCASIEAVSPALGVRGATSGGLAVGLNLALIALYFFLTWRAGQERT